VASGPSSDLTSRPGAVSKRTVKIRQATRIGDSLVQSPDGHSTHTSGAAQTPTGVVRVIDRAEAPLQSAAGIRPEISPATQGFSMDVAVTTPGAPLVGTASVRASGLAASQQTRALRARPAGHVVQLFELEHQSGGVGRVPLTVPTVDPTAESD